MNPFILPAALKPYAGFPHWVIWRFEERSGKKTKVPFRPKQPSRYASSKDPETWSDYQTALNALDDHGDFDRVGFCLMDSELAAFDIDDCIDQDGSIHAWALALIKRCNTYAEITPSGRGLRIIGVSVSGEELQRKLNVPGTAITVEPYRNTHRYITVTGDQIDGTPDELVDIDAVMDAVVEELGGEKAEADEKPEFDYDAEDIKPDDKRLGKLAAKWIALGYDGVGIDTTYKGDRSDALMAFVCECHRAGIDEQVIAACLMSWKIGEHVRNQANVRRALKRTIERAREFVANSMLAKMNEVHCVLPIGGSGKTRVITWGDDPVFPKSQLEAIVMAASFTDFKQLHDKHRHSFTGKDKQGNPVQIVMGLGTWWLSQPNRRQYDGGMRFMPQSDDGVVGDTLNLWQGFAVKDRKPDGKSGAAGCKLFLDHGLKIICSGNEEHYDFLIKREALIAQRRIRSEIAVCLQTEPEGTGKGRWCRRLNHLYGDHAMQVQNPDHVIGKHNAHLERLLRLTADEALFALDPRHRNALYHMITEPDLKIEPKFIGAYTVPNYLNVDVISNARHYVPVSGTARRFFIPTVSQERVGDFDYFRRIDDELRNDGGFEALLYHLLHEVDLRDFNVLAVPKTAALLEQAAYSRKGIDLLVEKACNEAVAPCTWGSPGFSICSSSGDRYGFDYFVEHHSNSELKRMSSLMVKRRLAKEWKCKTGRDTRKSDRGARSSGVVWPPLAELRAMFVAK